MNHLAVFFVLLAGCAPALEPPGFQKQIDQVRQTAEQALENASKAQTEAASASTIAGDAKASSDSADACCAANDEKIDRMFEKANYK